SRAREHGQDRGVELLRRLLCQFREACEHAVKMFAAALSPPRPTGTAPRLIAVALRDDIDFAGLRSRRHGEAVRPLIVVGHQAAADLGSDLSDLIARHGLTLCDGATYGRHRESDARARALAGQRYDRRAFRLAQSLPSQAPIPK